MRNKLKTYFNRLVGLVLIPVFILLGFNASYNWHYHIMPNGELVCHAHPYNHQSEESAPVQSHQHNNFELFLINTLSNSLFLISAIIALFFFLVKKEIAESRYYFTYFKKPEFSYITRGPPVY